MSRSERTSRQEIERIDDLRALVRRWTPIDWTLDEAAGSKSK